MRELNLGTYTYCVTCNRRFWTEDGIPFCSSRCENAVECPKCGGRKEPDEEYCKGHICEEDEDEVEEE